MIAQAVILKNHQVLMVKQYVERGDIVWNFPGGSIEQNESPEEACIREVKEETGYDIRINKKLHEEGPKFSFLAEIIGGELFLDTDNKDNDDIIEIAWIPLDDSEKFDHITLPMLELVTTIID